MTIRESEAPPIERILIVGLGSIGRRHARVASQVLPDARIMAWRHRVSDDALPPGVDGVVASAEEALAFAPQAAVVASPATHHLAAARVLAGAGVHLLVEKPIAASAAGVDDLIASCATRGVVLAVGYNLRFLPSLIRFRDLLVSGVIGRVLSIRAEAGQHLGGWRPDQDYRHTVSAQAALGGGVLLELSHELDYLRWIFGEVAWVRATLLRQSDLEIDVEDTAHLVLGFSEGKGSPPVAAVSLDFVRHDSTRQCLAIGTEGSLRWNAIAGTVEHLVRGRSWETVFTRTVERDATYLDEWRDFAASVAARRTPAVTGADGLAVMRIVDAARRSSAAGGGQINLTSTESMRV